MKKCDEPLAKQTIKESVPDFLKPYAHINPYSLDAEQQIEEILSILHPKAAKKHPDWIQKLIDKGGSYGYLRKFVAGDKNYEIHHMPAASCSPLSRWRGPCIIMTKEDHKRTSSYGNSKQAREYRQIQKDFIQKGQFLKAELMDVNEIRELFGRKYDSAINKKLDYEEELEKEGKIYANN